MIKKYVYWLMAGLLGLLWLVINIRVESGMATPLEKAIDGLVGTALLLVIVFGAISFFVKQKKR